MREQLFGYIYKKSRENVKKAIFNQQQRQGKVKDLEPVINWGKKTTKRLIHSPLASPLFSFNIPSQLSTDIYDLSFPSPVTVAAYESNLALLEMFCRLGVGGLCYKTMMMNPRPGNAQPRIQEIQVNGEPALVNALGLPGKGAKAAINAVLDSSLRTFNRPIGLSIGGDSLNDYKDVFTCYHEAIKDLEYPFYYEINISCPNTEDGKTLAQNQHQLHSLIDYMREHTQAVISIKISPDRPNDALLALGKELSQHKKICCVLANSQFKTCNELKISEDALSIGQGGLSGPSLFERTLEMVQVLAPLGLPIIATGGIDSADKVRQCLNAGASLVGMATALAMNPYCIVEINRDLAKRID